MIMKGSYEVIIRNNRIQYKFTIYRNITILRGDSATGKTTLIEMVDTFSKDGLDSGIEILCKKKCIVLERGNWMRDLENISDSIVFIDEGNGFVKSVDFSEMVKNSSNYYVIATRDSLFNLPYSIREVYGVRNKSGNRYQGTKRIYSEFYPLYNAELLTSRPDKIIVEDSNSGYQFFSELCKKEKIICETAEGKDNLYRRVRDSEENIILVVADGAAFGPEMENVYSFSKRVSAKLFLPESFEWLILNSGIVGDSDIADILAHPYDFVESEKFFSWEKYYTSLLVARTQRKAYKYDKGKIAAYYLSDKSVRKIIGPFFDDM